MIFIAKDKGGDWHYDGEGTYWCLTKEKKPLGKIMSEYLPDPYKIWESKCEDAGVTLKSQTGKQLKPNPVVFKLWEHKNAKSNA